MIIHEIIWPKDRIEHIARHNITPQQFEEVCFGSPLIQRARQDGENPVYYVLGQTASGLHLLCIVIQFPSGQGYPVTARPMTNQEKQRYTRHKNR